MSYTAWAVVENIATLLVIATIVVGVYAFGGGGYGWFALLLLRNMNINIRDERHRTTEK